MMLFQVLSHAGYVMPVYLKGAHGDSWFVVYLDHYQPTVIYFAKSYFTSSGSPYRRDIRAEEVRSG